MRLDGMQGDEQPLADFLVGQPVGHQLQHRKLPRSEAVASARPRRRRAPVGQKAGTHQGRRLIRAAHTAVFADLGQRHPRLRQQATETQALTHGEQGLQALGGMLRLARAQLGKGEHQLQALRQRRRMQRRQAPYIGADCVAGQRQYRLPVFLTDQQAHLLIVDKPLVAGFADPVALHVPLGVAQVLLRLPQLALARGHFRQADQRMQHIGVTTLGATFKARAQRTFPGLQVTPQQTQLAAQQ
ncbi:hypothetical protein D3C78_1072540 [compost metagenome]